jgi:protein-L-isoaspartate(D-aspartate) O-methyltransferase
MMKQLLLLTFVAVASEAMAQDAQCVPERAAMVDTIRAYARSEAGVLGPQGISERVLQAMGQTQRHRFIPAGSCSVAYQDAPVLIGHDQTIPPLAEAAAKALRELGYDNVSVKVGDGYLGWPECGPFDAMVVTAAVDHVPPPLTTSSKITATPAIPSTICR